MARAAETFLSFHLTRRDDRHSDDEDRFHSIGMLGSDVVIIPWTLRGNRRRIVTMWKANDRERQKYLEARDRSG
ncbi:MAG: BrnT family toxin [Novosphingobium sp.]